MSEIIERVAKAILDAPLDGDCAEPNTLRHIIESFFIEAHAAKAAEEIGRQIAGVAVATLAPPAPVDGVE